MSQRHPGWSPCQRSRHRPQCDPHRAERVPGLRCGKVTCSGWEAAQHTRTPGTRPLPGLVPLPHGGLRQPTRSPGIRRWRWDGGRWGAIAEPWAGGCPPARHGAPHPAREDLPAPCQPSPALRWDPGRRLWVRGAGGAGWAGACRGRPGAAAAGGGTPAPVGAGTALGTRDPAPCWIGAASGQCSAPDPTAGAMSARCSAPAPLLPNRPCTTCFSSSSVEGKPSPALPSWGSEPGGPSPLQEWWSGRQGEPRGVPRGDPPLPDPRHHPWGAGTARPTALPGCRLGPGDETPYWDGDQGSPPTPPPCPTVSRRGWARADSQAELGATTPGCHHPGGARSAWVAQAWPCQGGSWWWRQRGGGGGAHVSPRAAGAKALRAARPAGAPADVTRVSP